MAITGDGKNFSTTPAMYLRLPTPGVCGPLGVEPPSASWLEVLNSSLSTLDSHSHAPGYGIPVPAAGINLNADVPFNANNATALRSVRFSPIGLASLGASDLSCLAVSGGDLYFVDAQANQVRLTASGGVAGTPGSIANLAAPAASSYIAASKLFTFTSSAGFVAGISAGPLSIGDATLANGKAVTIGVPAGLAANYSLTLPTGLPAANALLGLSTTGVLSAFGAVSGNDLTLAGALSVSGILTAAKFGGLIALNVQGTQVQPTSYWSTLTPDAGVTATNPIQYWKDVTGMVHLRGYIHNGGASAVTNLVTTAPLPAGFLPEVGSFFPATDGGGTFRGIEVTFDGKIVMQGTLPAGGNVTLSGISYLAGA